MFGQYPGAMPGACVAPYFFASYEHAVLKIVPCYPSDNLRNDEGTSLRHHVWNLLFAPHFALCELSFAVPVQVDPKVVEFFHKADKDRTGRINASELSAALSQAGLHVSTVFAGQLIRIFDKDNTGT